MKSRDFGGSLQLLRPRLRRLVPQQLHHLAGHFGRWVVRTIESRVPMPAIGAPARLPACKGFEARDQIPIVLVSGSLTAGGAERQVVNLLHGLKARGRCATLLTLYLGERSELSFFLDELEIPGLEVRNAVPVAAAIDTLVEACGRPAVDAFRRSLGWAPADIRGDILRVASELHRIRPRVVHGWQDSAGIVAAFAALAVGSQRIVVGGRNLHPDHFSHARPYMRAALRFLATRPEVVLTNNSAAGARSYAEWLGVAIESIPVVRNGIASRSLIRPAAAEIASLRRSLGLPPDCKVVGGAFRLQAEKRPLLWLKAASLVSRVMPEARFVIFGDGTMRGQVQKAAVRLGLGERLIMPGNFSDARIALAILDVLLLSSAQEGTPNVVLEAGCLGVPVVATDSGGTGEAMLEEVTGLLVREEYHTEQELAKALADATIRALSGGISLEKAGHCGPAYIEKAFGFERMIDEMIALYEQTASAPLSMHRSRA